MGSAIQKANQVLESAADELHKTIESVVSAGLEKSHALVAEATELDKSLREEGSKMRVGELHADLMLECARKTTWWYVEKCFNIFAR